MLLISKEVLFSVLETENNELFLVLFRFMQTEVMDLLVFFNIFPKPKKYTIFHYNVLARFCKKHWCTFFGSVIYMEITTKHDPLYGVFGVLFWFAQFGWNYTLT